MARFPRGVFTRCRVVNRTSTSITARIPGNQLIFATMGDDCSSSGLVTVLSDGNRAIAISGNQGRPTLQQMEEFFHSRPIQRVEAVEEVTEEEKKFNIKVLFGIDKGEAGYEFYIGGDRKVPALFHRYTPSLAKVTGTEYHGWLNNTKSGTNNYRAHVGILALSEKVKENAPCCTGAAINVVTGEETPFGDPPGWVGRVTVRNLEERKIVVYTYSDYQEGGTDAIGYQPLPGGGFATEYGSSFDIGLHISGACYCDLIPSDLYTMKINITIESRNIQTYYPPGWNGVADINEVTTATAVYGVTRIENPAGALSPPGATQRMALQRLSYTGDPAATANPDPLIYAAETYDVAAVDAYFQGLASEYSDSGTSDGMVIAPGGASCADINLQSVYPNGPSPGFPDACSTSSTTAVSQFLGFRKLAQANLRDFFAGATCGKQWMGEQVVTPCQPVLTDTYSYCVELTGFPDDPNVVPVRKETPPDGHPFFDGWVGVEGTTEFDMEVPGPGYGPVAVESVEFSYCNADPMVYQLIYQWANPDGDNGQIQETGEGLPTDTVTAEFRDQNWYDWRSSIGEGDLQEGRVNSLPVFTSGDPKPLVLPGVQVEAAEWVATSPDRTRAIAKLNGEWRLYTGGASSVMTVPPAIADLLNNYPKSINWQSPDTIYVVAATGAEFATTATPVRVHKLKLVGAVLSEVTSVKVTPSALGNGAAIIFSVSASE